MPIPSVDQSLAMMLLPTVLSLIAGSCDIITFIGLGGLFTAHITGNLVVLTARAVAGDHAPISYILSVPVFVAALALTTLFAALLGRAGMASPRPLLILQLLLLSGSFLLCVASGAPIDPTDGKVLTAGMLARVRNGCTECHRVGFDKGYAFDCRDDHERQPWTLRRYSRSSGENE
jgi:uncharacterized membrane protein YoaK (UPF0700 family)